MGVASPGGVLADICVRNDLAPGSICPGLITTAATLLPGLPGAESVNQYFSIASEYGISQRTPPGAACRVAGESG